MLGAYLFEGPHPQTSVFAAIFARPRHATDLVHMRVGRLWAHRASRAMSAHRNELSEVMGDEAT